MTSFATLETSQESSRPLEIYEIEIGTQVLRYTSAEDDLGVDGEVYRATSIARGPLEAGADSSARGLTVTLPSNNELVQRYRNVVPGVPAQLSLWRLQRDEIPTFDTRILLFRGLVVSVKFVQDGYTAELSVRDRESAQNRNMPRFTFGAHCGHILYDSRCGATTTGKNVVGTVSAVTGNIITLPGANAKPDQYYRGGYCRPVSGEPDFRLILSHVGNNLTLLLPFASNPLGTSVQAFAGCDHTIDGDCALKHDRVAAFGGFAWVPRKNIFQSGL